MSAAGPSPAAFIDRDGVINYDRGFVHRSDDFEFLPGVPQALAALKTAGYKLVIITNQSGIARGLFTEALYLGFADYVAEQLATAGAAVDATFYCPHLPDATVPAYRKDCNCRKPAPGMLVRARDELCLDMAASLLIGDRASDIAAGRAAGVGQCYLVHSGKPLTPADLAGADADFPDLAACVRHVLLKSNPHPAL